MSGPNYEGTPCQGCDGKRLVGGGGWSFCDECLGLDRRAAVDHRTALAEIETPRRSARRWRLVSRIAGLVWLLVGVWMLSR